ncbi:MAG TPA: HD domain-containing phosphohydrolase [Blastocatellia bacterium]|nr:HD domain-containing phosphohydrolase [Blastocatellia bacterium]
MVNEPSIIYKGANGENLAQGLAGRVFRIGRNEGNDLTINNPYISRYHAEIIPRGANYQIRDLGSTSGTFVNGERIKQRNLRDGDSIRLGQGRGVELVFRSDSSLEVETLGNDDDQKLQPIHVKDPEQTRFLNTSRLPHSGELTGETVDSLRSLYEFMGELLAAHSPNELCDKLAQFLHRTLKGERCAVMLYDNKQDQLEVAAACETDRLVRPSSSIASQVFNENVSVMSLDASHDERFSSGDSVRFQSIRSVMCAPLGSKTRVWGVCYVDNVTADHRFDEETLDFLTAVGRHSGLVLENLYLLEEQRRSLESFIRTLAASLDARDDNTAGHSSRVGAISSGIARFMGFSEAEIRLIYYAGLLHDYGKIGIRDDVLLKPAMLTPEEYEHVKQHPLHTFRLLSKIRFPEDLAEIPLVASAHHERWDGTGYPDGLRGEEIPIGSRIVAVADAYDAMTEDRCYHEGWSPERAVEELESRSGTYFDPAVIEAFLEYFKSEIEPRQRRLAERKNLNDSSIDSLSH